MKLASIDIETTGLNPDDDQILEFVAIYEDTENPSPFEEAHKFHRIVKHPRIQGGSYALQMNNRLLRIIAGLDPLPAGCSFVEYENDSCPYHRQLQEWLMYEFQDWVNDIVGHDYMINAVGASLSTFDVPFIDCTEVPWRNNFFRRILEIESLYAEPTDERLPGLADCMERAGLEMSGHHEAMNDAWDVIRLLRHKWNYG